MKKTYITPLVKVVEIDPDCIVCQSISNKGEYDDELIVSARNYNMEDDENEYEEYDEW